MGKFVFNVLIILLLQICQIETMRYVARSVELFKLKGQLISKCLYEIIVWTKIPAKILIVSALALSGQKSSNFFFVFWSKRRLQKDILKLTDLYHACIPFARQILPTLKSAFEKCL